ncbi:GNAT family N-acetyltransferase [Acholeplasma equirhinis]|uniref:GNAT family N-acetyltransferase n=1 Tax=Acholeplasma equirhinis TaxID=555393 RepID=UPI00197AB2A9|nr:GNAT family N-acetyltransferase [Acholeplasma equirhinis]MBN3490286.1 GNAT family N-acetyltransferase [Acholeplasma equirhinis]
MLPELIGKRIILRPPRQSDLVSFFYYASKPSVGPSAGWFPHQNLDETRKVLDLFIREENIFAITIKPHDVMVGTIGFHNRQIDQVNGEGCEIGFALDDTYWNKGYMTEAVKIIIDYAFTMLKFDYLMVSHADFNLASKKVIEKCGFTFKYKTHKTIIENPEISELWYYKMTKEDYFQNEKRTIN